MNQENIHSTWLNYAGNICTEQTFGVGNSTYWAIRTISKALYDQIPDTDWRKITWIAPEDAGKNREINIVPYYPMSISKSYQLTRT